MSDNQATVADDSDFPAMPKPAGVPRPVGKQREEGGEGVIGRCHMDLLATLKSTNVGKSVAKFRERE